MSNRFISNILVLLLFGIGFFGVTFAINWFAYGDVAQDHEFSFERRTADKHLNDKNWEAAARYYKQLIQADPENGGATVSYAWCLAEPRQKYITQIDRERRSNLPDQSVIDTATEKANEISAEAIAAYEQVLQFARFRNHARFQLARMHSLAGDKDAAVKYLVEALKNGYPMRGDVRRYTEFQPILDEPDIQALFRRR